MKIGFLAIPKCASRSLLAFCQYNELKFFEHKADDLYRWRRAREEIQNQDVLFCALRDPVERVQSAYFYLKNRPSTALNTLRYWKTFVSSCLEDPNSNTFSTLESGDINLFVERGLPVAMRACVFFIPQWAWLDLGFEMPQMHYLRVSHLQQDLDKFVAQYNLDRLTLYCENSADRDEQLTKQSINTIRELYRKDYELIEKHT